MRHLKIGLVRTWLSGNHKGGISDALKRAAVLWGIGRYLYYPSAFDSNRQPAEWATPEGYDKLMAERHNKDIDKWRKEYESAL